MSGDFDGDGKTMWPHGALPLAIGITRSSNGVITKQWGQLGDKPVRMDYDTDGRSDIAVFRPLTGTWYVAMSRTGQAVSQQWGAATDVPVNNLQQ